MVTGAYSLNFKACRDKIIKTEIKCSNASYKELHLKVLAKKKKETRTRVKVNVLKPCFTQPTHTSWP